MFRACSIVLVLAVATTAVGSTVAAEPGPAKVGKQAAMVVPRADLGPLPIIEEFVRQQYRDFVDRQPTTEELTSTAAALRSLASSPEQSLDTISHLSPGAERQAGVTRLYRAMFLRLPDAGGLTYWEGKRAGGRTLVSIANEFTRSSEFVRRYGKLGNDAFIRLVYGNVLGRKPDPGGRAHWLGRLAAGTSRGQLMTNFSESSEYRRITHPIVDAVWATTRMLGRVPTTGQVATYTSADPQPSFGTIAAGILRSAAYRGLHPEQEATNREIDAHHDGVQTVGSLPDDLSERWTAHFDGEVQPPMIGGGRVFVTEGTQVQGLLQVRVWALDIDDGSVLWGPAVVPGSGRPQVGLVYGDGTVFALTDSKVLTAFRADDGAQRWSMTLPEQYTSSGALTYDRGRVYANAAGNAPVQFAVDATDGSVLWSRTLIGSAAPTVDGDDVYIADARTSTYKVARDTGATTWFHDVGGSGTSSWDTAFHEGRLYVQGAGDGAVIDAATGSVLAPFTAATSSMPTFSGTTRIQRIQRDPADPYGALVATDEATGDQLWNTVPDEDGLEANPVAIGEQIFIGGFRGTVFRFRTSDGATDWHAVVPTPAGDTYPPQIDSLTIGDGLLVADSGKQITAFG